MDFTGLAIAIVLISLLALSILLLVSSVTVVLSLVCEAFELRILRCADCKRLFLHHANDTWYSHGYSILPVCEACFDKSLHTRLDDTQKQADELLIAAKKTLDRISGWGTKDK
jgi:hypothetical protein